MRPPLVEEEAASPMNERLRGANLAERSGPTYESGLLDVLEFASDVPAVIVRVISIVDPSLIPLVPPLLFPMTSEEDSFEISTGLDVSFPGPLFPPLSIHIRKSVSEGEGGT